MTTGHNFDWRAAAETLLAAFPVSSLHPAALSQANASNRNEPWCVAFSGGADSLALLLLIYAHWPERRERLVALHFNHCLRGAESDGDEQFCRDVCVQLGIAFHSTRWAEAKSGVSEAIAREARHDFFRREMMVLGGRVLWTGHHKNDVAETLLMRLARGAGPAGLAAPRPVQAAADGRTVLRPLLTLTKKEIVDALAGAGVSWREDATNAAADFFRNRVRAEVIPVWKSAAPNDVIEGAALSRERCEEDDAALEAWLDELAPPTDDDRIDLAPLLGKPRALWRRALRRWRPASDLGRAGFEELLALCERGEGRVSLADGFAVMENGVLRRESPQSAVPPPWPAQQLNEGAVLAFPGGATLNARRVSCSDELKTRLAEGRVDPRREAVVTNFDLPFTVRPWQPGDRYRPLGAPGSMKLQDLFVNRKIAAGKRAMLPVVCAAGGEIVWVPGFPPVDSSKVTAASEMAVQLTYHPGTSTVEP